MFHSEWNLKIVNLKGDQLASVELKNDFQSNRFESDITPILEKSIITDDTISSLNIANKIEKVMAEAVIKAGFYPIHPVRYKPKYDVVKSKKESPQSDYSGKLSLLFSAPSSFFSDEILEEWESLFDITYAWNAPKRVTKELLKDKEIWVTGTCPPYQIDKSLIESSSKLKLIATPSTGTNHIDLKAMEEIGLTVLSIKNSEFLKDIYASSEHSFALLLAMTKKINITTQESKYGHWREREEEFRTVELHGRSIGLIGYGRIGSNMARYCRQFGMKILVYDPFKKVTEPWIQQVNSRDELLNKAEIVSLHYHLTDETKGSFSRENFERMRNGSYFLNTARGELVDEIAMIDALKSGKLRAAAVDVISGEDKLNKWDHPVIAYARDHNNLIVSPHTAGLTIDSESKAAIQILREIKTYLQLQ